MGICHGNDLCKRMLHNHDMLLNGVSARHDAKHRSQHAEAQGRCSRQCDMFPLPWEQLLVQLQELGETRAQVPRTGEELGDFVRILLNTSSNPTEETTQMLKICIHQARVRRAVVAKLIMDAKARGHPAYQRLDEVTIRKHSVGLPEDGIPEQLLGAIFANDETGQVETSKGSKSGRCSGEARCCFP